MYGSILAMMEVWSRWIARVSHQLWGTKGGGAGAAGASEMMIFFLPSPLVFVFEEGVSKWNCYGYSYLIIITIAIACY